MSGIINSNELESKLVAAAQQDPTADARDIIIAWVYDNAPAVYQELMNEIGDADTADEYGASGMDEPNVNEGWGRGNDRVTLSDDSTLYWSGNGPLQDEYDALYNELVPSQGKADTIEGEVLRAASKIVYRHYNDGDDFNQASFEQLVPYIGAVTSYDDLAHKSTEFAMKANGNYTPNPSWDSLDVMEYGPEEDDYEDEEDDSDWYDDEYEDPNEEDEDLAEASDYDEDQVESIQSAIIRRILGNVAQHSELIKRAGPDGIMNAARDVASFHAPVEELGSSDISAMVREVYNEVGVEYPELNEGRMKEVAMDIEELSNKQFYAKYKMSKEDMKAKLAEGQGDDYVNKDVKMKRMGAKPLGMLDKLKTIPQGMKAMARGDSEDDLVLYNKSKATNEDVSFNEAIEQMRKIAGLK
jgi:hypothetical protein